MTEIQETIPQPGLHVLELIGENLQPIKAVLIPINAEGITEFTGANGAGKTTAQKLLWWTIAGKAAIGADKPIRKGQTTGKSEVKLSNGYRVVRTYKLVDGEKYTTDVILYDEKGAKVNQQQTVMSRWISENAIDPLAITRMDDKSLKEFVCKLVGIDLSAMDEEYKRVYSLREAHYPTYNAAKAKAESLPNVLAAPPKTVSVSDLNEELSAALAQQDQLQTIRRHADDAHGAATTLAHRNEDNKRQIEQLEGQLAILREQLEAGQAEFTARVDLHVEKEAEYEQAKAALPDIAAIQQKLAEAGQINQAAAEYEFAARQRNEIKANFDAAAKQRAEYKAKLDEIEANREKALAAAKFPVEGLGFDENGLTFEGLPFKQASQAQKIRVGMAIAMAENPVLRVITTQDGSLLDPESWQEVNRVAVQHGYQVIMETVDVSGLRGVVFRDGEVVAVNQPTKTEAA